MDDRKQQALELAGRVAFPVTKEELINALLVDNAPGNVVDLVERLPHSSYDSQAHLAQDLEEVAHVHRGEVNEARTYNDFLATVLLHTGDIQHTSKETFNRVTDQVMGIALQNGSLDADAAEEMRHRLYAAWVDLRKTMDEVYDNSAPTDPRKDLPQMKGADE